MTLEASRPGVTEASQPGVAEASQSGVAEDMVLDIRYLVLV